VVGRRNVITTGGGFHNDKGNAPGSGKRGHGGAGKGASKKTRTGNPTEMETGRGIFLSVHARRGLSNYKEVRGNCSLSLSVLRTRKRKASLPVIQTSSGQKEARSSVRGGGKDVKRGGTFFPSGRNLFSPLKEKRDLRVSPKGDSEKGLESPARGSL